MGKISKLMKLLSASAVVAGANSVALADCGLCGENEHETGACPHFDYRGYGLSKGYTPKNLPENDFLGNLALADRQNANAFLNIGQASTPASSTISFATPTGDTAVSTDTGVATSYDNTWSNTETTTQSSNEKSGASDKINALKFERTQDLEDRATMISESDAGETEAVAREMEREEAAHSEAESERRAKVRAERLAERRRNQGRANFHEERNRAKDLQNLFDEENARKAEAPYIQAKQERARVRDGKELVSMASKSLSDNREAERNERLSEAQAAHSRAVNAEIARLNEKAAHQRDTQELKDMMRERVAEDLGKSDAVKSKRDVQDLDLRHRGAEEAKGVAYDNRAEINISDREKIRILAENISQADERRNAREARNREATAADELRKTQGAANKIQNAARARLARKKAAELKAEAERQGKIQEHRENAAARKITEALRKNKERKQAERQARNRFDELLAEQEQLRENLAAEPVAEAKNGADFEYRSEQEQTKADNLLAQQEQAREYLGMNAQEPSNTTATRETVVADEESETDRWTLPQATAWNFKGFDLEYRSGGAKSWARQLENLSIRKLECMLWLVSTSYQQLQNTGRFAPTAQMAEAISDVNNIFPYSGMNAGVMNVYNAFQNTDTANFVQDLERLGTSGLDGVLYYIANQYMHLLSNGKKAASAKFIELAKATLEHFNVVWEAEDAEIVPDNKDVVEAPRDPVNFKAVDKGIVETEAQETERWNPPYRIFYAYTHEIPHGLRPTSKSMRYYNDPELFKADLRSLTIRRLEVLIYLANGIYRAGLKDGASPLSDEFVKLVEDVDNVFPKQGEPNVRVFNVYNAFKNLLDKPNDNEISMQPFQKGFRALNPNEKVIALGDIAVAYREMLRNGKRPASLAFVKWADEICRVRNLDGFVRGADNVHPELKFEEFENEAKKPQVSDTASANNNPAVVAENSEAPKVVSTFVPVNVETEPDEGSEWYIPRGLGEIYGKWVNIHEEIGGRRDLLNKWGKKLRDLNIRRLEVVMYLAARQYGSRDKNENRIEGKTYELAGSMHDRLFSNGNRDNKRLSNCLRALNNKQDAIMEFSNGYYQPSTYEGDFEGGLKRLKTSEASIVLGEIAVAYREQLRQGKRPSHGAFVEFADEVCKDLNLDGWFAGEDDEDMTHPVYGEFSNGTGNSSAPEEGWVRRGILDDDNRVLVDPVGA